MERSQPINGVSTEFGDAFRKLAPIPTVAPPNLEDSNEHKQLHQNRFVLNWYPKIQAMKSGELAGGDADAAPNETHLTARHVAFLDLDRLHFELESTYADGVLRHVIKLHGMSGGPVWRFDDVTSDTPDASAARLVGIMIEFCEGSSKVVIAVRISVLVEWLRHVYRDIAPFLPENRWIQVEPVFHSS